MKPNFQIVFLILFVVFSSPANGEKLKLQKVSLDNKVTLHYAEQGTGEPIIFVHGLTGDSSYWTHQVEAFAKKNYRAITYSRRYNFPNDNQSRPNHSAAVDAEDLAGLIRKLGLKKTHVVGFSFGGYSALLLAIKHPELVQTLTLAEPPLAPWLSSLPGEQSQAGRLQSQKLLKEGVIPARAAFKAGNDELAMRTMIETISGKGVFEKIPKSALERIRRNVKEMKAVITSRSAYPFIPREKVRQLKVPTLILSGSKTVATARYTDPELERLLPERSRKRIILKDATHNMWMEQPENCRTAVLGFIKDK